MKKAFKTQAGRFVAGLIALLLVVGVTAAADRLSFLRQDVSAQKVMTMSEESTEIARAVEEEVDIYYLATDTGKIPWVEELARRYSETNRRISYEQVDPASTQATELAALAGTSLTENSLVVASADRCATIAASDIYEVTYNEMYYYYYGELLVESQKFVADSELANAILYVTRDDMPVIYALTGHGESSASGTMLSTIQTSNVAIERLRLDGSVPEDAAAVLIYAPTSDLTDAETEALLSYLKTGGELILLTDYSLKDMPNLKTVTAYYGMEPVEGLVLEMTSGYSYSTDYPQYLTPDIKEHEITAALIEAQAQSALMPLAGAIERNSIRRTGLNVTELLTTSDTAYMKVTDAVATIEQEETDPSGRYVLAMAASEGDTRVIWYASTTCFSDDNIQISGNVNLELLSGTLKWMVPIGERVTIEGAELVTDALTIDSGMTTVAYVALFVPALAMLAAGLLCGRRKKTRTAE